MAESAVRLDRWLWAARFFKTRSLATGAVAGGKVHVNGERSKPAKLLRVGDRLRVRVGPYEHDVIVRGLAERRGPARAAAELYEETPESRTARLRLAEQHRVAPSMRYEGKGRPTKKDRREIERLSE
jgi:ribosome-associated heat shock protein Hsp15